MPSPSSFSKPNPLKNILLNRISLIIITALAISGIGLAVTYFLAQQQGIIPKKPPLAKEVKTPKELVFAPQILSPSKKLPGDSLKAALRCPVSPFLCRNKNAFKESSFSAQLTQGAPLFAAFDGSVSSLSAIHPAPTGEEKYNLVILTNNDLGLQAMYSLKGTVTAKTDISAGEVIATSSGQPVVFMNKSFIFTLIEATEKGGESVLLSPNNFK